MRVTGRISLYDVARCAAVFRVAFSGLFFVRMVEFLSPVRRERREAIDRSDR
jgi:hypothetical protein